MPKSLPFQNHATSAIGRAAFILSAVSFGVAAGCNSGSPEVDTNVPQVRAAATPDLSKGKLPKGMPKNTTAGLKIDPTTGRPSQE